MRALLIWAGIALVEHFDWIFIVSVDIPIFTGLRLAFKHEVAEELENGRPVPGVAADAPAARR